MRWQAYKMSAFYISLSEDVPAGFGDKNHQIVIGKVKKGWHTINLIEEAA